jgi:hypothetical protein
MPAAGQLQRRPQHVGVTEDVHESGNVAEKKGVIDI